jgi:hypothetical protein
MRSRMIALAMVALVGAGCVSAVRYVYIKTGTTAEQRDQDESECTRLAMINVGKDSADGCVHETLDRARLRQCMAGRGYEVQEVKS